MADRESHLKQSLGVLQSRIRETRSLLVGAGGIGCELLKNLVLSGFGEVHIIDLDTIDLSNLNRQFLFRHEHIKKSKALIAKETATKFNPRARLEAYHANIKDSRFNTTWFQQFGIVFNALDNLDARRHVNRMCLAANVTLIESGTTGFNGQIQVIKRDQTECYDCSAKETPKTFPVCTIRSTPSQPIHSIVWAKSYLFAELFGLSEESSFDSNVEESEQDEVANLQKEAQALQRIHDTMGTPGFESRVFEKVFKDDIDRLRGMEDMWKDRRPPTALEFAACFEESQKVGIGIARQDQQTWTLPQNVAVFTDSLRRLSHRSKPAQTNGTTTKHDTMLEFDKDDEDILDFVAASANLRSIVFGIDCKSKFDIKQMAGNIIPAIATTNAMTAALCVLQAFKVLDHKMEKARTIFLERSGARVINSETLRPPNPECSVCSVLQSQIAVDMSRATLQDLVQDILVGELGYSDELTVNNDVGTLYDPELDDNLTKRFDELGLKEHSFLTIVDDEDESPRVNLSLSIVQKDFAKDSKPIMLLQKLQIPRRHVPITLPINGNSHKRKRSLPLSYEPDSEKAPKRGKSKGSLQMDGDLVILDDDNVNGEIVIDD